MDKIKFLYSLNVRIVRLRKIIKRIFPAGLIAKLKKGNNGNIGDLFDLVDGAYPWTSPNVWHEIVSFYSGLNCPTIVEFGTGASTINHIQVMVGLGCSRYIGIEDNPTWFWLVVASILRKANRSGSKIEVNIKYLGQIKESEDVDVDIALENISILMRLRTTLKGYLAAFDQKCDVVIVDGISRKECIQEILSTLYLREGGLLMLMEAGRGSDDWWEGKLYGDDDYSSELKTLLSLGGLLIDGNGVDNWPGCKRKSPKPPSYYYPMEACRLIMPKLEKIGLVASYKDKTNG